MKIRKHKNGQAMVETALVLPLILLLLFGIIEFGRILNTYIMLTNASREGARYSIVVGHSDQNDQDVKQTVINRVKPALVLSKDNVDVTHEGTETPDAHVVVTVNYDLPLIIPIVKVLVSPSGTFHIESSTIMRSESK